jgi:phage tail sheath gpL-like
MVKYKPLGFTAARGTSAQLSTLGTGRNSPFNTILGAGKSPSAVELCAAVYGAVEAFDLNMDPARPTQTLVLPGILPPTAADTFDLSERNILLHDGISTFMVDTGGLVRIERDITTYQANALGVDDPSMLDINTLATLAYIMDQVDGRITNRFPRHKLANDNANVSAGQAIARPKDVRYELIALFREMEREGIVENLDQFINDLVVARSDTDLNRMNALMPPDLVNQFRVLAGQVQYIL